MAEQSLPPRLAALKVAFDQLIEAHDTLSAIFDGCCEAEPDGGPNRADLFFACEDLISIIEKVDRVGHRIAGLPTDELEDPRGTITGYDKSALLAAADSVIGKEWINEPSGLLGLVLLDAFQIEGDQ